MAESKRADALRILTTAWKDHSVRKTFALFSGGDDSAVLAHWAAPYVDAAVHIDTGTGLPDPTKKSGAQEFAEGFCERYEIPLLVYSAGDAFERLVLDPDQNNGRAFGFPGLGRVGHSRAYQRLKERQVERLVRDHKEERYDRIALLTGVRRAESRHRMGWGDPINRNGAQLWVNPLIDWTDQDMRAYRNQFDLPQSDIAALCHVSGECTCGTLRKPHEREFWSSLFPEWARWVADLERRAEEVGAVHCKWGTAVPASVHPDQQRFEPMCVGCLSEAA